AADDTAAAFRETRNAVLDIIDRTQTAGAARTVVLLKGAVVEEGTTSAVLDAPAHDYTRRLVAAVP
ncbi:ABC transporter ATP-binding protein, partial [Nonomuraea sp. NPDC001684]